MNTASLRRPEVLDYINNTRRQTETICKGHLSRRNGRRRERRGAAPEVNDTGGVEKTRRETNATMDGNKQRNNNRAGLLVQSDSANCM